MNFLKYLFVLLGSLCFTLQGGETTSTGEACSNTGRALGLLAIFLLLVAIAALERARRFKTQAKQMARELENVKREILTKENAIRDLEESVTESKEAAMTKARFLATMSHEIRTPLNAIIGLSDFLDQPNVPTAKQREYAKSLNTVANALLALINDILDISKLESGNADALNLQQGVTNLTKVFEEMQTVFRLRAVQKGLVLSFNIAKDIPCITVLEPRVRQILLNVIGNAIKYTIKGSVDVSCTATPCTQDGFTDIEIIVKDTGIGISTTNLQKIFDPFAQDIESRQGKIFLGTGLGLAIVKRLVNALGGTITAESVLGQGSKFTINLPHLAIHEPVTQTQENANPQQEKHLLKKVLIVDDIGMNRKILGMYLKSLGISDTPDFASGKEALQYLNSHSVDIILSDMWMPEMNGSDFAKEVKKIRPEIPVVAVTADVELGASFDTSIFFEVLTKPVTAAKLKELLAKLEG